MSQRPGSTTATAVWMLEGDGGRLRRDHLATEEPMEIRVLTGHGRQTVAVTMRTPGHDFELAVGFLFGEGVIRHREDIRTISYCVDPDVDADQQYNIVNVALRHDAWPNLAPLERHFSITSACGVCGKASLEALHIRESRVLPPGPVMNAEDLYRLPDVLRHAQGVYEKTGGLHAAALFDTEGKLLVVREDVGRHNAVDKTIGWALMEGRVPLQSSVLLVSGRTSFEIMQKALAAEIAIVAAISAPSSLAVDVARQFGMTLVGFLRGQRCNVYTGHDRIALDGVAEG